MGIGDVELGEDETHGPGVRDGCSACHEDDEGALAANKVDQELEEGVDGEGLVDVAEGIDPGGGLDRHQTAPGGSGVDGHPGQLACEGSSGARYNVHEEDAHDISLEQRLAVVLAAVGSVSVQVSSMSRTSHYLRLQPHSSGSCVSGRVKQSTADDSHEGHEARHEGTHAGGNDDGMAEPLAGAAFNEGRVHVLDDACSHGRDGR